MTKTPWRYEPIHALFEPRSAVLQILCFREETKVVRQMVSVKHVLQKKDTWFGKIKALNGRNHPTLLKSTLCFWGPW